MIRIENIVAGIDFRQPIDLKRVIAEISEYNVYMKAAFPGAIVKGVLTFLVFRNGKCVCVGAESAGHYTSELEKFYRILVEKGIIEDRGFDAKIQNVVASGELGFELDVEKVAATLERVIYEPGMFPAAIHYMDRPKVTMLLFQSGRIVITGAKSEEEVVEAYRNAIIKLGPMRLERAEAATA